MKILLLLLIGSSVCLAQAERKSATNVVEMFGGEENLSIVTKPDKVDACILRYFPPSGSDRTSERYEDTDFISVPDTSAEYIRRELLNDGSYLWDVFAGCWPQYHVRLRFHQGKKVVDVDFCFRCKLLRIHRDGNFVDGGLFERRKIYFLEEFRRLFPKDLAIGKER